jgi:3-phenylpropionate/cinnamic acid dioxygenase small subunit
MNDVRHTAVFTKPATLRHVPVSPSVGYDIHEFLAHEALFLDYGRYTDWLTLLATDVIYRCPARVFGTQGNHATERMSEDVHDFAYDSLVSRARNLQDKPSGIRVRRLVSNVIVTPGHRPKEYVVSSYVLITGAPRNEPEARLMTVERRDVLRRCSHSFRLAQREISSSQVGEKASELALIF